MENKSNDMARPGRASLKTPVPQEAQTEVQSQALALYPPPFDEFASILFYFPSQQVKGGTSGRVGCIGFFIS